MANLDALREGWCLYRAEGGGWSVGVISGYEDTISPLATTATPEEAIAAAIVQADRDEQAAAVRDADYQRRKEAGELTLMEMVHRDMAAGFAESIKHMVATETVIRRSMFDGRDLPVKVT